MPSSWILLSKPTTLLAPATTDSFGGVAAASQTIRSIVYAARAPSLRMGQGLARGLAVPMERRVQRPAQNECP